MEGYKLRVKLGDHEFEAEGEEASVKLQFDQFKELLSQLPQKRQFVQTVAAVQKSANGSASDVVVQLDPHLATIFDLDAKRAG
jgi:hypothetical protein